MGALVALCLRIHGCISICLGFLALSRPRTFITVMIPGVLDSKWYCDESFGYVMTRVIHEVSVRDQDGFNHALTNSQHASQTMMVGAFMIVAAGQPDLHKNALRIAGFGAGVSICTSAGTWGDIRVAAYYVLWSLLYASAFRKDELNAKEEAKQRSTRSEKTVIETT